MLLYGSFAILTIPWGKRSQCPFYRWETERLTWQDRGEENAQISQLNSLQVHAPVMGMFGLETPFSVSKEKALSLLETPRPAVRKEKL